MKIVIYIVDISHSLYKSNSSLILARTIRYCLESTMQDHRKFFFNTFAIIADWSTKCPSPIVFYFPHFSTIFNNIFLINNNSVIYFCFNQARRLYEFHLSGNL